MHSGWRSSVPTECFDSLSKHSLKVLTIAHNAVAESNRRRTEALSTLPDVEVSLLTPRSWFEEGSPFTGQAVREPAFVADVTIAD